MSTRYWLLVPYHDEVYFVTGQEIWYPHDVSLNTIMVDGTGMCGACRLTIGGKTKFVCIDGPEFNGDLVNWDEMFKRMGTFKDVERKEMESYVATPHQTETLEGADVQQDQASIQSPVDQKGMIDTIEILTDRDALWRKELRGSMKPKERTAIARVQMPELDPVYRATTRLEEVTKALPPAGCHGGPSLPRLRQASLRGRMSSECKHSFFYQEHRTRDFLAAAKVLKDTSALPLSVDACVRRRNNVRAVAFISR
jgi:glutamate synthase (NADPH/NADH) small chain